MAEPQFHQVAAAPDQIEAEAVAALFFLEDRPLAGAAGLLDWRLNGLLTTVIQKHQASGAPGEQLWVQANSKLRTPWVLFMGGGPRQSLADSGAFSTLIERLLKVGVASGVGRLAVALDPAAGPDLAERLTLTKTAWERCAPQGAHCLVTFDQSWVKSRTG